jgi:hypothetical protein
MVVWHLHPPNRPAIGFALCEIAAGEGEGRRKRALKKISANEIELVKS